MEKVGTDDIKQTKTNQEILGLSRTPSVIFRNEFCHHYYVFKIKFPYKLSKFTWDWHSWPTWRHAFISDLGALGRNYTERE